MQTEASTAEYQYNLHRRHISSKNAIKKQSYDKYRNSNFINQFATDRSEQLTRFCVRSVKFANVAAPWDVTNPPSIYFQVGLYLYQIPLNFKVTTFAELVAALKLATLSNGSGVVDSTKIIPLSGAPALVLPASHSIFGDNTDNQTLIQLSLSSSSLAKNRIYFYRRGTDFPGSTYIIHTQFSLSNSPAASVPSPYNRTDALSVDTASAILGLELPCVLASASNSFTADYVYNLVGASTLFLCSQRLSTCTRAYETIRCLVKQCILTVPVAQLTNSYIVYEPTDPTVFVSTGDEALNTIDFSLRYENNNLVDLGANALEIELEVETVDIKNGTRSTMNETIHLPRFNAYDTQMLLGQAKKRARSFGFTVPRY